MKKTGYSDVVVGLQFGDEGKARIVDFLAKDYDIIARFNGGANAGHTIENSKGKVALRQVPSGVFHKNTNLYVGSGCAINIEKLAEEIDNLKEINIDLTGRLHVSSLASIIQPHQILLDIALGKSVGTTKNGIGPSYADRAMRMYEGRVVNIRLADLLDDPDEFFRKILENLEDTARRYKLKLEGPEKNIKNMKKAYKKIASYIETNPLYLTEQVEKGAKVLFEGAQSVMLDISKGSVPYVTSSSTVAGASYVGGDLPIKYHRKTIGVIKAVMSRVGHGPFPSEFGDRKSEEYCMAVENGKAKHTKDDEQNYDIEKLINSDESFSVGIALRIISNEYGTVTKRPRRIGILDMVQLKHVIKTNGIDELVINKCDLLKEYCRTKNGKMSLVTGYILDGKNIDYIPAATSALYRVKPKIEYRDAFNEDISAIRDFKNLPKALKEFIEEIEEDCGSKVVGLGVGPHRDQFINL